MIYFYKKWKCLMKSIIVIFISKTIMFFLKLLGRGSVFPGALAMDLDKNILSKFKIPKIVIAVTGSSGKTSTSYMIYKILKDNGYKLTDICRGSNLFTGFINLFLDNSNIFGNNNLDAIVMEIDERYTKEVFSYIKPTHVLLSNITRDQPPRHGNYKKVYDVILAAIPSDAILIINGDDPIVTTLASKFTTKKVYFGVEKNAESYDSLISSCLDMVYCPKCKHKLKYNYVQYGNVGSYYCPNCDFKRPNIDYAITDITRNVVTVNNKYKIKTNYQMLYLYYNLIAAISMCSTIGIEIPKIIETLNNIELLQQRYEVLNFNNRNCYIINGKNENATSYNQAINYIRNKKELKTIVFGFEYISKRYPYQDISWLYDIDFELLSNIDKFICIGPFANEIALRILVTNKVSKENIIPLKDFSLLDTTLFNSQGTIYAVLNMGTEEAFIKAIKGVKHEN